MKHLVPIQKTRRARSRRQRGQAMLEYSILNWVLVIALVLGATVHMVPVNGDMKKYNVIELFLKNYQTYYNSFYFVLNLPFP